MVEQDDLRSQNDAAYARGQAYIGREDGWEQIHCENGVTTYFNRAEMITRTHGIFDMPPHVAFAFIIQHTAEIRQKYSKVTISSDIVYTFEDKSIITREVNNYRTIGEIAYFKYGIVRPQSDASIHIVFNTPEGYHEFPKGLVWLDFQLGIISDHEGGSAITIFNRQESSLELTVEQQNEIAMDLAYVHSNGAKDLSESIE